MKTFSDTWQVLFAFFHLLSAFSSTYLDLPRHIPQFPISVNIFTPSAAKLFCKFPIYIYLHPQTFFTTCHFHIQLPILAFQINVNCANNLTSFSLQGTSVIHMSSLLKSIHSITSLFIQFRSWIGEV